MENTVVEYQCGLRSGRSTTTNAGIVYRIYDRIKLSLLYNEELRISARLKRTLQMRLQKTDNRIEINNARLEKFEVRGKARRSHISCAN